MKIFFVVIMLLYCAEQGFAQRALYSFLRNEPSARAAALGGAFSAVHDDPTASFLNPAVIATAEDNQVSATFFKHALDINAGFFVYNTSLHRLSVRDKGSVAIGVNYMNYGQFDRADRSGVITGAFGGGDVAFSLTYANALDSNWFYGVTAKYINNRLDNSATGAVAIDAGMLYNIPKAQVNIALSVLHAGTQLASVAAVQEELPLDVRLGFNHRLRGLPLLFNFSLNRLADQTPTMLDRLANFSIGLEFYFGKAIRVRAGYDNQRRRGLAPDAQPRLAGFAGGVGLVLNGLQFDYGLNSLGMIGIAHRFTVNLQLDKLSGGQQ